MSTPAGGPPARPRPPDEARAWAYELGEAVVLFRRAVELAYVRADDDPYGPPDAMPVVPDTVDIEAGRLRELTTLLGRGRNLDPAIAALTELAVEATALGTQLYGVWWGDDHRERLRRREAAGEWADADSGVFDLLALTDSAVGPPEWAAFEAAADCVAAGLPAPLAGLFCLGRLRGGVVHQLPSGFDRDAGCSGGESGGTTCALLEANPVRRRRDGARRQARSSGRGHGATVVKLTVPVGQADDFNWAGAARALARRAGSPSATAGATRSGCSRPGRAGNAGCCCPTAATGRPAVPARRPAGHGE